MIFSLAPAAAKAEAPENGTRRDGVSSIWRELHVVDFKLVAPQNRTNSPVSVFQMGTVWSTFPEAIYGASPLVALTLLEKASSV